MAPVPTGDHDQASALALFCTASAFGDVVPIATDSYLCQPPVASSVKDFLDKLNDQWRTFLDRMAALKAYRL
ncbi:unnamed protein product [Soboliphyme baturini]|uniref:Uncharacterized protein n=1 Tax=Soboliphyme baturini TaxID=241478 RepID=A0A183IS12_9BILA|nr:unnamed protein product [Soboliphyme baturini]